MARACPLCDSKLSQEAIGAVPVERCARCQGLWLDAGSLTSLAAHLPARERVAALRGASGRCRKGAHRVPQGMVKCLSCSSAAARCPSCGDLLAAVAAPSCVIDVCRSCAGVWLDAGELEALQSPPPPPAADASAWEVPTASSSATGADPWNAPGQFRGLPPSHRPVNYRAPFECHLCEAALSVHEAWAHQGDVFCQACRPGGAVGGHQLPREGAWSGVGEPPWADTRYSLGGLLGWGLLTLFRAISR